MPHPLFTLTGQTALVTGATGGIGRAVCTVLGELGARLVLMDRLQASVDGLAEELRQRGIACLPLAGDLAVPSQIDEMLAKAQAWSDVDVLVCNAGVHGPAHDSALSPDTDWAAYRQTFAVNVDAPFHLCQRVIPGMAERGGGAVVLMSSIAGLRGNGAIDVYGMTKAALAQMARNLAVQWGPRNVRVNAVSPGVIETPFATAITEDDARRAARIAQTPLRRFGAAEEVAAVVACLACAAGGFVTGHNLVVDGGTTISDGS